MTREKIYENKIKSYLADQGAWFVKFWGGGIYTKAGIPDILACVNGHFVAIEVKADHGHPSELQLHTVEEIRDAGGFAFVLYPSGWAWFKEFVEGLKTDTFTREMEVIIK
jgi:Holliday junction resolvase